MNIVESLEAKHIEELMKDKKIPEFRSGDTVKVNVRIKEGQRERLQAYEGVCIARSGKGLNQNFTVRKISYGEGVERVFSLYSPLVDSIEVVRLGSVRRSKLYYLRSRRGKSARITERKGDISKKTTKAVAEISLGLRDILYVGNLNSYRDWGYAGDYVEAMWRMLQAEKPDDYVVATGETHSVREFCERAFARVDKPLRWVGEGVEECGIDPDGNAVVRIDPGYFRPAEVDLLLGDSTRARQELRWEPQVTFDGLVDMMVDADMESVRQQRNGEVVN